MTKHAKCRRFLKDAMVHVKKKVPKETINTGRLEYIGGVLVFRFTILRRDLGYSDSSWELCGCKWEKKALGWLALMIWVGLHCAGCLHCIVCDKCHRDHSCSRGNVSCRYQGIKLLEFFEMTKNHKENK